MGQGRGAVWSPAFLSSSQQGGVPRRNREAEKGWGAVEGVQPGQARDFMGPGQRAKIACQSPGPQMRHQLRIAEGQPGLGTSGPFPLLI